MRGSHVFMPCLLAMAGLVIGCAGGESPIKPPPPTPAAYVDKHIPDGWWTDPKIIEEGQVLYEGKVNKDVNCANCHGRDGKPRKRGATDLRKPERMKLYSDSHLFWRVSEGMPKTKMKGFKAKLTEEERWKIIAYFHGWSHGGNPAPHDDYASTIPVKVEAH